MPKNGARDIPPPLELECLKALWTLGEGNVKDVRQALTENRNLAYTTVMTVLDRLARKGGVARRKVGRSFVYAPVLSRGVLRRLAVQDLVDRFFEGSREALLEYLTEERPAQARRRRRRPKPISILRCYNSPLRPQFFLELRGRLKLNRVHPVLPRRFHVDREIVGEEAFRGLASGVRDRILIDLSRTASSLRLHKRARNGGNGAAADSAPGSSGNGSGFVFDRIIRRCRPASAGEQRFLDQRLRQEDAGPQIAEFVVGDAAVRASPRILRQIAPATCVRSRSG